MPLQKKYSVLLCTDEPTRAAGFERCFAADPEMMPLPYVEDSRRLIERISSTLPHVLVLHGRTQMVKRVLASVKSMKLDTQVLLWSGDHPAPAVAELSSLGLAAVLDRRVQPEELVSAVRSAARGEHARRGRVGKTSPATA